ncbi:MAG: hypothetical protein KOO63_15165 [Bacteroidales bacterium]|nr:hypothetical protein [Candidatus Latescibacterota bacterium]
MNKRTAGLVISISILGLSLLTAFKVIPGAELLGISLAFLSIFILPGIYINYLFFGKLTVTVEGLSRVFSSGMIFSILLVSLGFIPGLDYPVVVVMGAVATAGMAVLVFVRSGYPYPCERRDLVGILGTGDELSPRERKALLFFGSVIFVLLFVFYFGTGETGVATDAPDHLSYIGRSVETGRIFPSDSFFKSGDGGTFDPRKGMWHPVMALWAFLADTSPLFLWRMLPSFLSLFYLLAFWVFAREILKSLGLTILASVFLILLIHGDGLVWLTKAGYSKNMMLALYWLATGYLIRYIKGSGKWNLSYSVSLSLAGVLIHPVFSLLLGITIVSFLLYSMFSGRGAKWRVRLGFALPFMLVAIALPVTVRLLVSGRIFNEIHTHAQGLLAIGRTFYVVDPVEVLSYSGLSFFYIVLLSPLIFLIGRIRESGFLAGLMFLLPVLLVLNPLTSTLLISLGGYLYYRLLDAAPMACVLSVLTVGSFRVLISGRFNNTSDRVVWWNRMLARGLALILIALIALPLRTATFEAFEITGRFVGQAGTVEGETISRIETLLSGLPSNSVISSDPETSYLISAVTDHFVTVILGQHGSPADSRAMERIENTRDLFSPVVPLSESLEWLDKEGVGYIVLDTKRKSSCDFFNTVPIMATSDILLKFRSAGPVLIEDSGEGRFLLFSVDVARLRDSNSNGLVDLISTQLECCGMEEILLDEDISQDSSSHILYGKEFPDTGIKLESMWMETREVTPGDTLKGWFCWKSVNGLDFGFPLEWTVRLDTDYPKGAFFREWYDKQYRRVIERRLGMFFRMTRSTRLMGGRAFPDQWKDCSVKQEFRIPVPDKMTPGVYAFKLSMKECSYLPNRRIHDYLRNRDSLDGQEITRITIRPGS